MTVQELRDLLNQAATLPWTHDANSWHYQIMSADDNRVASKLWAADADLIVAAVNALPALLDLWEVTERWHRSHHCDWAGRSAANLEDAPPCPICDALDQLDQ